MAIKDQYNQRHITKFFNIGDKINPRLHQGYTLPGITNQKTGQQSVEPLTILECVGKLAYRLKISFIGTIHQLS